MVHTRTVFVLAGLVFLWMTVACNKTQDAVEYRFEAKPRAVLEKVGVLAASDPKLRLSPSGTLAMLAVYKEQGKSRLGLFLSHDGGDTFGHRLPVSQESHEVISHGENSPSLVYTPTAIYALWEQANPAGHTDLMFARSIDFGHSFQPPLHVTQKEEITFNGFSTLGIASNGYLYAVWLDGRERDSKPGTFSVYLARSSDGGASFGTNTLVAKGACPCCRPSITFDANGAVYLAWRNVFDGNIRDMVVSKSQDGLHFEQPVRVSEDNWRLDGCPDSGPALQFKDNRLFVAWYTEAAQDSRGIKLAWSDDGARSFKPAVIASGKILDVNHPAFSLSPDGRLLLAFQGRDPSENAGWTPSHAYLIEIGGDGKIHEPLKVPGTDKPVSYPIVLAGPAGRTFFAWTEPGTTERRIVLIRGREV